MQSKKTVIKYLDFQKEYKTREREYIGAVRRVFYSGYYVLGEEVGAFEEEFSNFLGVEYCVGVANGLEALQISLMALGVKEGDEVITTPISAVATTLAILAVGAKPQFVDIKENGQLDENLIERAINNKTKVVLTVHLYGQPSEIDKIESVCKKHGLYLIEDAAQAHGSTFKGKKLGSFGDVGCFSFYPTKNLGAIGDGGAIATNNKKVADVCYEIRDYGQSAKYVHSRYGLNSRLDELQAAILREKLRFLDNDNNARREIAKRYMNNLKKIPQVKIVISQKVEDSNFHLFVIKTGKRDKLKEYLFERGIPSLIHFPATIPDQPLFGNKYKTLKIPVARKFVKEILSLPCHPFMKLSEVDFVTDTIDKFF